MNSSSSSPGDLPEGLIEIDLFANENKVGELRQVMKNHFGATEEDRINLFGSFEYWHMRKFTIGKKNGETILEIHMKNGSVWNVRRSEGQLTLQKIIS